MGHWDSIHISYIWLNKKSIVVILFYLIGLVLHLSTARLNDKIRFISLNETNVNITKNDISHWINLATWKDASAVCGWVGVGMGSSEDILLQHLKGMVQYAHLDP